VLCAKLKLPVLIDTTCRSSFQHPPDRPDFRRTDWANFQTHLEDRIPFDPELHDGMAIHTCVENFSGAVLKTLVASTHKRRPRADKRPPIPFGIHDEIRLKNRLRRQYSGDQEPHSESRSQPPAEVGDLPAQRVEERPVECHIRIPRSRRPVTVDDGHTGDESSYSVAPPQVTPGETLSQTLRKPKPLLTLWRLSFSRWLTLRSRQLLRWLTWR